MARASSSAPPRRWRLLVGEDQRLRAALETPADAVLDLLRRVRLRDLLREEELQEALVVAAVVVDVALRPALVGVEGNVGREQGVVRMRRRQARHERRDRRDPERRCRVRRGQHQRPAAAVAERRRAVRRPSASPRARRGRRRRTPTSRTPSAVRRTVRAAVAARIECDDAEVAREIRDLRLPEPRVRDRRRREEQERRRRVAVDLVEDAHAVALDVALLVGVARTGLLACADDDAHRSRSTNSRTSRLNMTGSRACGACPPPSTRTNSPPPCCASASPRV